MTQLNHWHTFWRKYERIFFFGLTVLAGVILLTPLIDFQYYLAPGDHGRDLYAFKKTMEGSMPYRGYSWLFGPLMPYYYSLFYIWGGVSIQSVLFGQVILAFFVGILIYLICISFISPALSFLGAFWYWSYRGEEFFHTYNHVGGIVTLLIAFYCIVQYIKTNKSVFVYVGYAGVFLFALIRLNMGVATLIAYVCSLILINYVQNKTTFARQRNKYLLLGLATLATTGAVYWFLLHPLPGYIIYESFPYQKTQRTDHTQTLGSTIIYAWKMFQSYFTANLPQKIFGFLLIGTAIQSGIILLSDKFDKTFRKNIFLIFSSILIFLFFCSHEFMASGVPYRILWFIPLIYILIFYLVDTGTKTINSKLIKILIFLALILSPYWNGRHMLKVIESYKIPPHHIQIGNNSIYTMQHPAWIKTVTDATNYLKKHVPPEDTILAVPFDPLYFFLSERDSAAHQLVFFKHINIPKEQEIKTIEEMEKRRGNWVLISNRSDTTEWGTETFGKEYCPLLAQYVEEHFSEVARFGEWNKPPGWAWDHGVKILKRN